jgi:hypothetical protein
VLECWGFLISGLSRARGCHRATTVLGRLVETALVPELVVDVDWVELLGDAATGGETHTRDLLHTRDDFLGRVLLRDTGELRRPRSTGSVYR